MHPIIVVEGPDGAGKTTLSNVLAKQLGAKELHLTYRWPNKMFHYHTAALECCLLWAEKQPVILDRWWPSERIYADVYRGGSPWPMGGRMLDRVALKHRISYVLCLPQNREAYLKHFAELKQKRVEMYDTVDKLWTAYRDFQDTVIDVQPNWHLYDWMETGEYVEAMAEGLAENAWDFKADLDQAEIMGRRNYRNAAGNFVNPKAILVGERSNPKVRRQVWPFFQHDNSSLFITQALDANEVPERDLMWFNLWNPDGESEIDSICALAEQTGATIVALGSKVSYEFAKAQVKHYNCYHPAYAKRFGTKEKITQQKYGALLKEAIYANS